jgi:hypothetical protein
MKLSAWLTIQRASAAAALLTCLATLPLCAGVQQFPLRRSKDYGANRGWGRIDIILRVAGDAMVSVRGANIWVSTPNGQSVTNNGSQCSEPFPNRPAPFELRKEFGRGQVTVTQKPSTQNQFTLVFRISDPQPGASIYNLRVVFGDIDGNPRLPEYRWESVWPGTPWRQPRDWTNLPGTPLNASARRQSHLGSASQGGFSFDGTVDNDVVFFIRGNQVRAAGDSRRMPSATSWSIIRSLPGNRRPRSVKLNTRSGNAVQVIEYPSFRNFYTMVVRVAPPNRRVFRTSFSVIWD